MQYIATFFAVMIFIGLFIFLRERNNYLYLYEKGFLKKNVLWEEVDRVSFSYVGAEKSYAVLKSKSAGKSIRLPISLFDCISDKLSDSVEFSE